MGEPALATEEAVEIKIGVQDTARELAFDSNDTPESVTAAYEKALATDGLLTLKDDRDRTIVVPASKIAYLEIAAATRGRVGFGSL
jgi:hypothetical protein